MRSKHAIRLLAAVSCFVVPFLHAAQTDMHGPAGSVSYGSTVAALPNGNFVVTDPDGPISGLGAVYLYTPDGSLISTLTGAIANDHVGNGGIRIVGNNFLVVSYSWNNGAVSNAGAVTWVNGSTGSAFGSVLTSNVVSSANSLVGTHANDGDDINVVSLNNGNYVVGNASWNGNIGAATWCKGDGSTIGAISSANSLIGSAAGDFVGVSVKALSDGNYVVVSYMWSNPSPAVSSVGAVTWLSGSAAFSGTVSSSNSLIGTTANDQVGSGGVSALSNGHYVVSSSDWHNISGASVGAVTWRSGGSALPDAVSTSNSLFGTTDGDHVGNLGSIALSNGNYVVKSVSWNNTGAATWGNGATGTVGPVTPANSLVGSTASDFVGSSATALPNGNYVVGASLWNNGAGHVGAAILLDGSGPYSGTINTGNALFGTTVGDSVSGNGISALSDGNYLVMSSAWDGQVGAATWGNGTAGVTGPVLPSNSLTGSAANDALGNSGNPLALSNGNYIVFDSQWNGGLGAATWCRAGGGCTGPTSAMRSVHGATAGDAVGGYGQVFSDGNFAFASPRYTNGIGSGYGAVTLGSGRFRLKGVIASWNSVIGGVQNIFGFASLPFDYDSARQRLVVGRPTENIVSLFTMDQIFADDFDP